LSVNFWAASAVMAARIGASMSGFIACATGMSTSSDRLSKMRAASFGFIAE